MEGISQWTPIILMIFALYFLFILPQSRKAKKEKKFLSSLKNGDLVVTKSGMHGKIIEVNDTKNTCVILTMAGKIKFDKSKPDGSPRKLVDSHLINQIGFKPKVNLEEGIIKTYKKFLKAQRKN